MSRWYGPEHGRMKAHCNRCGEDFEFCITEGGGPALHPCKPEWVESGTYGGFWDHRTSYDVEVLSVENEDGKVPDSAPYRQEMQIKNGGLGN